MRYLILVLSMWFLLSGCTLMVGAAAGGAAGYYVGKEGYRVKIEKER